VISSYILRIASKQKIAPFNLFSLRKKLFHFFINLVFETVSYYGNPGYLQSPECWDYRCVPPHLAEKNYFYEGASINLCK
jgi:hypothetical protein